MEKDEIIKAIEFQREQIQEDISSILDGLDNEQIDLVCQVVVDRMNDLIVTVS